MRRHLIILTVLTLICIGLAVLFAHCAYAQEMSYTPSVTNQIAAGLAILILLALAAIAFVKFISKL